MNNDYIVFQNQKEHEAILMMFNLLPICHNLFASLGIDPYTSWFIIEAREHHFPKALIGEVDIIGGRFNIKSINGRDIIYPQQSTEYLVGIETKCAFRFGEQIKSKKSSPKKMYKIREKTDELLKVGFNKVALIDFIANPPTGGQNIQAWLNALSISCSSLSLDNMEHTLLKRLSEHSSCGHWVWSKGSVVGGNELERGAGGPIEIKSAKDNPLLDNDKEAQERRNNLELILKDILTNEFKPSSFPLPPLILIDCIKCGNIHRLNGACKRG